MLLDARDAATPDKLAAQVIIVGSGAAGVALGMRLAQGGVQVLLVEAGGQKVSAVAQEFYRAATIAPESHGPTHLYRRRALGGTTAIWGGRCIPFDPIDFEQRDWIAHSGWPMAYEDVAAYYGEALAVCQAGAPSADWRDDFLAGPTLARAASHGQAPMVEGVTSPDLVLDRIERFSQPANFGKVYGAQMQSSQHLQVLLQANVIEILTNDEGTQARGVLMATADGTRRLMAHAPLVVVATGGIETPRLLLASRRAKNCGLGNELDLVGRFYQAHIEGEVGELLFRDAPEKVLLDYQRDAQGIYCRRYIWLSPEAQRRERTGAMVARPHHPKIVDPDHRNPILSAMYLVKDLIVSEYARKMTSTEQAAKARYGGRTYALYAAHLRNIVLGSPQLARFAVNWVAKRNLASRKLPSVVLRDPRGQYVLDINAEQTPNPESRIMLGNEVDALGVPRLAIRWRTVPEDYAMIARGLRAMQRGFAASAGVEYRLDDASFEADVAACTRIGGHHIGTARMGASAQTGVVDANGEAFGTKGLFVCGAATFPTSGFANPTLTIVAMALRLADHLRLQLKEAEHG